ncbi:uncharacterized protein LAESUDRAFT_757189 [Laetiporus sulphureus 93-53]|uniref:Uncharacterized protein n=1 Tax=Laetiporus sulphureus 93-53 TaxID=1314785 RepID=A0A165FIA9_9APHY|nr:uncharacterized protein LAESUDRAFT_757189 [Laetiporus sulphureus 93-53]KZT09011.1 hypothetical protein LAESUDRAFT_757189 [Laetiporus sulphureus 93-53]
MAYWVWHNADAWMRDCSRPFPSLKFHIGYPLFWFRGRLVPVKQTSHMSLPSAPPTPTTTEPSINESNFHLAILIGAGLGVAAVVMGIRARRMLGSRSARVGQVAVYYRARTPSPTECSRSPSIPPGRFRAVSLQVVQYPPPKPRDPEEVQDKYMRLKREIFELEEKYKEILMELKTSDEQNEKWRSEQALLLDQIAELECNPQVNPGAPIPAPLFSAHKHLVNNLRQAIDEVEHEDPDIDPLVLSRSESPVSPLDPSEDDFLPLSPARVSITAADAIIPAGFLVYSPRTIA